MKGLEAKGPFSCLGLQVSIKRAYQISINLLILLTCEILFKLFKLLFKHYFRVFCCSHKQTFSQAGIKSI